MDVQAYRLAVRLALDDQITRNLLQVSRDAIELNMKFVTITWNIKALTSAAREATSALRALNSSLNNEFSGAAVEAWRETRLPAKQGFHCVPFAAISPLFRQWARILKRKLVWDTCSARALFFRQSRLKKMKLWHLLRA